MSVQPSRFAAFQLIPQSARQKRMTGLAAAIVPPEAVDVVGDVPVVALEQFSQSMILKRTAVPPPGAMSSGSVSVLVTVRWSVRKASGAFR